MTPVSMYPEAYTHSARGYVVLGRNPGGLIKYSLLLSTTQVLVPWQVLDVEIFWSDQTNFCDVDDLLGRISYCFYI